MKQLIAIIDRKTDK